MAGVLLGPIAWNMKRDSAGHREYNVRWRVRTTSTSDGPAVVLNTPELPLPGAFWNVGGDVDPWATCRWDATVSQSKEKEGDPSTYWIVEQVFSTKPIETASCRNQQFQHPLLEPQKVSGGIKNRQEEQPYDRYGQYITNSAWEILKGNAIEFNVADLTVNVEQNTGTLQYDVLTAFVNTVNDRTLWGQPRRTILLEDVSWERKYHGTCSVYYTRKFQFTVRFTGWDRDILDEGTKVLRGGWDRITGNWILKKIGGKDPNPFNPSHFDKFVDRSNNPAKVILNGRGLPANVMIGTSTNSGDYFISLQDNNVGNELSDSTFWFPWTAFEDPLDPLIEEFVVGGAYARGQLVWYSGNTWLAIAHPVTSATPSIDLEPGKSDWRQVAVTETIPGYGGDYNAATTYQKFMSVRDTNRTTKTGIIHVERYPERNFLLLGVPVTF